MLDFAAQCSYNSRRAMKYYYLDSEKKVQGPVSETELRVMHESGRLSDETLAAAAGDSGWKPLSKLLNQISSTCSTWNNSDLKCPHCQQAVERFGADGKCPHCGAIAVEKGRGVWDAFIDSIRKSFDYKGRSTRTEFWGFCLFYYVFSLAIEYIPSYLLIPSSTVSSFQQQVEQASRTGDIELVSHAMDMYFSDPMVIATTGLYWFYHILMAFPFLAVSVRRLHDSGRSAAAVIFGCASHLMLILSLIWFIASLFINIDHLQSGMQVIPESLVMSLYSFLLSFMVLILVSLYLFIMMLLPGQNGINKYGCPKL